MKKFVTNRCRALLPGVLIDYLWQLTHESEAPRQKFVLTAFPNSRGERQEIAIYRGNESSWRSVFGFNAIDAIVKVERNEQFWRMQLSDYSRKIADNQVESIVLH